MSSEAPSPSAAPDAAALTRSDWLRAVAFVLGPLAVALIAIAIFRLTNDPFDIGLAEIGAGAPAFFDPAAEDIWALLAGERRARLLWQASILGLVVVSLASIAISLWLIAESTVGRVRRLLLAGLVALTAAMLVVMWGNDVSLEYTRGAILEPTVGRALALAGSSFTLDGFELSRKLTNSLSTAATIALVFAIIATTQLRGRAASGASFEQRARRLAGQVRHLHILLYASAAVLVTIILSMGAWLVWPVALAGTPETEALLLELVSGIGLFWGTSFTLVLAAAYLPSALTLNARIRALQSLEAAQTPAPSSDQRQATLARFGLNENVFAQVVRLAAILSPMVTSALPFLESLA